MAVDNADKPNIKDQSLDPDFSQKYLKFINDLRGKTNIDSMDKQTWKNKMVIACNQRLGVKRYTSFPYPGAPDIPLPETDKIIKKSLPNLVLSAWSPKKMCRVGIKDGIQATPELEEKARKAESVMNMFLRSPDMDWFKKLMLAADNRKQYGHCIFKIGEKFECRIISKVIDLSDFDEETVAALKQLSKAEKVAFLAERYNLDPEDADESKIIDDIIKQFMAGNEIIEFEVYEYKSLPCIEIIDPTKITVPSYTQDINDAVRIKEEFFLPRHVIEQLIEKEIFLKKDLEEIPYWAGGEQDIVNTTKARNEGIADNASRTDLYRMEMISCWYKEKESDVSYRKVFTFFADVADPERALAQDIDFPFEFKGWFYEKDDNEIKDSRYFASRGVPEQIRAMQEIMERCINNKIIRDEMSNTPMWEVLDTSQIMDAHVRMIPGAKLPVRQLGAEIKQLSEYPKPDPNSTEIMGILKAYTEEYLAVSDQLFRNATNAGGGKTLGEIQVGIQHNSGPLNLEVISWNETLSRVYQKMFYVLQERLGDSIYVDGQEVTREDFNFPATVKSNGDLEIANEALATQKAQMRLQVIMNPGLADIVNSEDRYNALKDWLEKDGVKDPDLFCTNPVEMAQQQIVQLQQQIQQMQMQLAGMQEANKQGIKDQQNLKDENKELEAIQENNVENIQETASTAMAAGQAAGIPMRMM
jgi:hypothetical protein